MDFSSVSKIDEMLIWKRFNDEIRPLLSPQIIDRNHPFPFLGNREQFIVSQFSSEGEHLSLGIVGVSHLPQYLILSVDGQYKIAFTVDMVRHFLDKIYTKQKIRGRYVPVSYTHLI